MCLARVVLDAGLHATLVDVLVRYVPRLGASVGGAARQAIMRVAVLWAWRAFEYVRVEFDQVEQVRFDRGVRVRMSRQARCCTRLSVRFVIWCV